MCTPIVSALNMEQLFTCPYEPAHRIRRYKIRVHLQKCRKNHPCSDMKTCVYNVDHIVPAVEYDFHLEMCEDRIKGDRYRWEIAPSEPNYDDHAGQGPALVPLEAIPDIEVEDDWSTTKRPVAVGSINAALQAQLKEKKVIVPKQGATKSERKAHYMEERRRHNGFEELNKPSTSRPVNPLDTSQPLRKPKAGSVISVVADPEPTPSTSSYAMAAQLPKSAPAPKPVVENTPKPKAPASVTNDNLKPKMIFPKGRGRAPGDNVSGVIQQEPKIGSNILLESKLNAMADSFQKFGIDKDGFCNLPIPNKGRGRKLNA